MKMIVEKKDNGNQKKKIKKEKKIPKILKKIILKI
jgi:hypothetical protein